MSAAVPLPTRIPHGRTARRLEWQFLPPHIRAEVERRLGSPVVGAVSQTSGFTPGFASVLTCADGTRHFVKAASTIAQRTFADAYREEARKLAVLPADVPAPRLQWVHDADDWVVLGIEHVQGRSPERPWSTSDLERCVVALVEAAAALTPAPDPGLADFAEEHAALVGYWKAVPRLHPDLPPGPVAEAAALASRIAEVSAGDTLVHTDVHDHNFILGEAQVWLCDWNWPTRGAAWLDSLMLLVGPRGDGADVDALIASHPLLGEVPGESIDIVLSLLLGHYLFASAQPVPPTSPHLREAQGWSADVIWAWLAERRGWVSS